MNPDNFKWFQTISVNLGVAGVLFFLLFIGYVPSPLIAKLDAHISSTSELARAVAELDRTVKILCSVISQANKLDSAECYYPPPRRVGLIP